MRVRTANTLRSIDNWIDRFRSRNYSFLTGIYALAMGLASSRRMLLTFPGLIIGVALHFAAVQLGVLILLGFFLSKLYSYRMVNIFLTKRF